MIRGYFLTQVGRKRPFVTAMIELPTLGRRLDVRMLVDTGADRSVLSPAAAGRLGLDLATLRSGVPSRGVGGQVQTRAVDAVITLGSVSIPLTLAILEPPLGQASAPFIPSLLGRDVLSRFALFVDERTGQVLLLEPQEADALPLP